MGVDNDTDTPGAALLARNPLTGGNTPAAADSSTDADAPGDDAHLWAWIDDRRDGSTWDAMQDDGAFPAWL